METAMNYLPSYVINWRLDQIVLIRWSDSGGGVSWVLLVC